MVSLSAHTLEVVTNAAATTQTLSEFIKARSFSTTSNNSDKYMNVFNTYFGYNTGKPDLFELETTTSIPTSAGPVDYDRLENLCCTNSSSLTDLVFDSQHKTQEGARKVGAGKSGATIATFNDPDTFIKYIPITMNGSKIKIRNHTSCDKDCLADFLNELCLTYIFNKKFGGNVEQDNVERDNVEQGIVKQNDAPELALSRTGSNKLFNKKNSIKFITTLTNGNIEKLRQSMAPFMIKYGIVQKTIDNTDTDTDAILYYVMKRANGSILKDVYKSQESTTLSNTASNMFLKFMGIQNDNGSDKISEYDVCIKMVHAIITIISTLSAVRSTKGFENFCHRDLHLENMFFDVDMIEKSEEYMVNLQVIDLGLATMNGYNVTGNRNLDSKQRRKTSMANCINESLMCKIANIKTIIVTNLASTTKDPDVEFLKQWIVIICKKCKKCKQCQGQFTDQNDTDYFDNLFDNLQTQLKQLDTQKIVNSTELDNVIKALNTDLRPLHGGYEALYLKYKSKYITLKQKIESRQR